ncbi:MAG: hypothetical protein HUU01_02415 [Saprospiraceae bacterium]|nr:hypothetical protein [Saprospiraceae bacterium]
MKNIFPASIVLVLSFVAFWGCNNPAKPAEDAAAAVAVSAKYICPMNCEKGKTYDQPGTCPVCNMNLEPVKAEETGNTAEYFTDFVATPQQLEAGKPALLSFTPRIKGNESAAVPLDLVHEKKMHLILVSDDLSWFDHIHPEYQANGAYEIKVLGKGENFTNGRGHSETRFDAGGKYWAFADFKPSGGLNQVNKIELNVAGTPAKASVSDQPKMATTVDGYAIKFDTHGGTIASGSPAHLHIDITEKGQRLTPDKIENYLGAKAHVILVEATTKEFVHVHPEFVGDELEMNTTFAKPGTYRGWLQFQTKGKVHTADFALKVDMGKDGHEGHGHDDHSGH